MALNDHAESRPEVEEIDGPSADGDPMGTPAANETVLWKGRPDLAVLARSAFHTRKFAFYFGLLIVVAILLGNPNAALVCAVLGVIALAIMQGLAWMSVRTTTYIITDARLIMRIGMAIETRINIPLKHIGAAHLKDRGNGHGDIAVEVNGERILSWLLLWPHNRPLHYSHPQPMLRAIPNVDQVAALLAEACAQHEAIDRNLTQIKDSIAQGTIPDGGLTGAPA